MCNACEEAYAEVRELPVDSHALFKLEVTSPLTVYYGRECGYEHYVEEPCKWGAVPWLPYDHHQRAHVAPLSTIRGFYVESIGTWLQVQVFCGVCACWLSPCLVIALQVVLV